jgi:hypothetical protein
MRSREAEAIWIWKQKMVITKSTGLLFTKEVSMIQLSCSILGYQQKFLQHADREKQRGCLVVKQRDLFYME